MEQRGLVLAGGGVAGVAWEVGVLFGLWEGAPDTTPAIVDANVLVGTSAGSVVAAQISSGTPLEKLLATQLEPASAEIGVDMDLAGLMSSFADAASGATLPKDARRRIGAMALAASTVPEADRRAVIAARLPSSTWADRPVLVTAVDAETGDLMVFDRDAGVELTDAVAASCAVPGVWPPVTIGGRRYVDGGVRSGTNADLAAGADRVLILTPFPDPGASPLGGGLAAELEALAPAKTMVTTGDEASLAAFGTNPLDPATRAPAARAGWAQGRAMAAEVARFWAG